MDGGWTWTDASRGVFARAQTAPVNARRARRVTTAATAEDARETRRAALVSFTAAAALAAKSALAITIPSQASSGGLGRGSGIAFSSTEASMSAYTLEGTKKKGISVKQKRGVLANARAQAEEAAGKKTVVEEEVKKGKKK